MTQSGLSESFIGPAAASGILVLQFHDISKGNDANDRLSFVDNWNGTEAVAGKQFGSLLDRAFCCERDYISCYVIGETLRRVGTQKLFYIDYPQ